VEIAESASPHVYTFDSSRVLAPGERIVVARDPAVFQSVYGTGINLAATGFKFDGKNLSNAGERIVVRGPSGQTIHDFVYDDEPPWPTSPDGGGPSLEIIDPMGDPASAANWRASFYAGGSPGSEGLPLPGDYDANRVVDGDDLVQWRANFGRTVIPYSGADGNGDGVVDAADYVVWRKNLGASLGASLALSFTPSFDTADEPAAPLALAVQDRALAALFVPAKRAAVDSAAPNLPGQPSSFGDAPADDSLLLALALATDEPDDYQSEYGAGRPSDMGDNVEHQADELFALVGASGIGGLD